MKKIQILRVMKQNILLDTRQAKPNSDISEIFKIVPMPWCHIALYTRKTDCMSSGKLKASKNPENIIMKTC